MASSLVPKEEQRKMKPSQQFIQLEQPRTTSQVQARFTRREASENIQILEENSEPSREDLTFLTKNQDREETEAQQDDPLRLQAQTSSETQRPAPVSSRGIKQIDILDIAFEEDEDTKRYQQYVNLQIKAGPAVSQEPPVRGKQEETKTSAAAKQVASNYYTLSTPAINKALNRKPSRPKVTSQSTSQNLVAKRGR